MATLPRALLWQRADTAGTELALLDDRNGLVARGVATAAAPIPYSCRYELTTDGSWAAVRLEVICEGGGWRRSVRLERATGRWRVTTAEQGDLDTALRRAGRAPVGLPGTEEPERLRDALDVDLGASPLFNTLPIRRLALRALEKITVVWVRVPSLEVTAAEQIYTPLPGGKVRFSSESFTADLTVDSDGFVTHYPGLATRV